MEKIKIAEAREMVQALGEKCFNGVKIIDSFRGEFVIEDNGNYFTVEIKPHAYRGQLSSQVLERFKENREYLKTREEARNRYKTLLDISHIL